MSCLVFPYRNGTVQETKLVLLSCVSSFHTSPDHQCPNPTGNIKFPWVSWKILTVTPKGGSRTSISSLEIQRYGQEPPVSISYIISSPGKCDNRCLPARALQPKHRGEITEQRHPMTSRPEEGQNSPPHCQELTGAAHRAQSMCAVD